MFLKRHSALDLLPFFQASHQVGKEITESMACLHAVLNYTTLNPQDSEVNVLVIGDGTLPRTGALFAFNTAWEVTSIDPKMNLGGVRKIEQRFIEDKRKLERLHVAQRTMEDFKSHETSGISPKKTLVVVRPHSHCEYKEMLPALWNETFGAEEIILVDLPCCVNIPNYFLQEKVVKETEMVHYKDTQVWSPCNSIYLYKHFQKVFDFYFNK